MVSNLAIQLHIPYHFQVYFLTLNINHKLIHAFISLGIFAYLNFSTQCKRDHVVNILIEGLKRLEYRGYDSTGMQVETSLREYPNNHITFAFKGIDIKLSILIIINRYLCRYCRRKIILYSQDKGKSQ